MMSTGVLMMAVGSAAAMSCTIRRGHDSTAKPQSAQARPVLDGGSSCLAADHKWAAACPVHEDGEIFLLSWEDPCHAKNSSGCTLADQPAILAPARMQDETHL